MEKKKHCQIAIIGIGCYYPGAKSPLQLWENILSRRQQFRQMPDLRLPNNDYYDPDPSVADKTYLNKAAVLDGYKFDWLDKRIPKKTYESTDIVHWLALDTALQAIADARYNKENINHDKTGVVLGNTLTGEFTRSNTMLLRWPYVRKVLRASLKQKGLSQFLDGVEYTMEKYYKSVFTPVTEDTLAGGLANTIAGRICNYLDIHGGGYIVDGACSSSLLAICTAANYLELGQMDMVIAGGVDISLDTFELIGFAKTGALTRDEMRVYDKQGKGFIPGEGCGIVVLKRLEDAIRDNDQVYAILNGWGIASDGKGGITAPNAVGQSMALLRAYEKFDFDTEKLTFIEGHGTGTTVGDKTELEGISLALNHKKKIPYRNCGVTSFKSIVGHTKAAAGVGAFIKTVIALNRRILPPTAGLRDFNPIFDEFANTIYPITQGQIRNPESILFAGVSAMGFGGINSHVLLQSGDAPSPKFQPPLEERKLLVSDQSTEVFLFAANTAKELTESINSLLNESIGISYGELADLAFHHNKSIDQAKPYRAGVVASTPFELERKLKVLKIEISTKDAEKIHSLENDTIVFGRKKENLRIGALFPGQGSQQINMTFKLHERFDWAKNFFINTSETLLKETSENILDAIYKITDRFKDKNEEKEWKSRLTQTNIAQPSITYASLLWKKYLERIGITFSCASGHSLGELMAFHAAGLMDEETLIRFAAFRGNSMACCGSGTMASLVCETNKAEEYIKSAPGYVTIANINAPEQTVISGDKESIAFIIKKAEQDHIAAVELPVSAAFHSELVSNTAKAIENYELLKNKHSLTDSFKLISSVTGKSISDTIQLSQYFSSQAIRQVNFINAVTSIKEECDILIEVGPGKVLSGLTSSITNDIKCFPVEAKAKDETSFNTMLSNIFVYGKNLNIDEIYADRLIRDFVPASKKEFIVNPLERPIPEHVDVVATDINGDLSYLVKHLELSDDAFKEYLLKRGGFIKEIIQADIKHLNLTNISVSEGAPINAEPRPIISDKKSENITTANRENKGFREILYSKIENATGFPASSFTENMKLLDDFNLDSIKARTLLNETAKYFNIQGKAETSDLANASLLTIIERFAPWVESEKPVVENATKPQKSVKTTLFDLVTEKTGFPADQLSGSFRLLNDLNLDSIKAGSLLAELIKNYQLQGKLEHAKYSNASLDEISEAIENLIQTFPENKSVTEEIKTIKDSVNSYCVELIEENIPKIPDSDLSQRIKNLGIVYCDFDRKKQVYFAEEIKKLADEVVYIEYRKLPTLIKQLDTVLVCIPETDWQLKNLEGIVTLLSHVAKFTAKTQPELCFLQWGDGYFSRNNGKTAEGIYSAAAYASSLHLEKPNQKIRVIEFHPDIQLKQLTSIIFKEFSTNETFAVSGYPSSTKKIKQVYEVADKKIKGSRKITLNVDDVILVTGGAKGITAECALAFAKKYRCKMALVGSSVLNEEIRTTLNKYNNENLIAAYYTCNITDKNSVTKVIETVTKELGNISGIIHGAGMNIPRKSEDVTPEEALKEIGPKLIGAFHLIDAAKSLNLKYFIALTSIIGVTGMQGNSWYAFSNETLDLLLRGLENKNMETIAYAYSVWNQVGMGERMGSTKVLAHMGIGSISPEQGISEFLKWIENKTTDQQIVIASALGGLDTWKRKEYPKPSANRYLEKIIHFELGKDIIVQCSLNRKTDRYADDHNYHNSLLFPTVFGLEAMAQTASMVSGIINFNSITIENISLLRPIVIPNEGEIVIQIKATIKENVDGSNTKKSIFTSITTEESNFGTEHFSAEFIFDSIQNPAKSNTIVPESFLAIDPASDLYSWLLFQGKTFQNINKIYSIDSKSTIFSTKKLESDSSDICFSKEKSAPFILGSPLLRDVLLQSFQLILTQNEYLPIRINNWTILNIKKQTNGGMVECYYLNENKESAFCDVIYSNENNDIIEYIQGYEVKALKPTNNYPLPEFIADISNIYSEKFKNSLKQYENLIQGNFDILFHKHNEQFNLLGKQVRHRIEEEIFENKYLPVNTMSLNKSLNQLVWDEKGKPAIKDSVIGISISHTKSLLLMTIAKDAPGCDMEIIEHRSKEDWNSLFHSKFLNVVHKVEGLDNDYDTAATRIWSVNESIVKAFGALPEKIEIEKTIHKGIIFSAEINGRKSYVLTFPLTFLPENNFIVALKVNLIPETTLPTNKIELKQNKGLYNNELNRFVSRFSTTFKDCKSFHGKTYFTDYPIWMGTLRELALSPIHHQLVDDLKSGKYGMVTNLSGINIYNEADALDTIVGTMYVTDKLNLEKSFIDLYFEWFKESSAGDLIKLADSNLSTTWVAIEGHGIVKQVPLPGYFISFLEKYASIKPKPMYFQTTRKFISKNDLGTFVYKSATKHKPEILLDQRVFHTGLHDSNSVGNLYYSNYYDWQAKMLEHFVYQTTPEIFTNNGKTGEYICLESSVSHLQEAMPFEDIEVSMYIDELYENGMKLYFEYYSINNTRRKLAYGNLITIWAKRDNGNDLPTAKSLNNFQEKILNKITKNGVLSDLKNVKI